MEFDEVNLDAIDVSVAELMVATPDAADRMIDPAVPEVLGLVREKMKMELVFVRADHHAGSRPVTQGADPLEASWGQQVLDERLARGAEQGQHQSCPVVLKDGSVYGTLCGFSADGREWAARSDYRVIASSARLIAHKIDRSRGMDDTVPQNRSGVRGLDGGQPCSPFQSM